MHRDSNVTGTPPKWVGSYSGRRLLQTHLRRMGRKYGWKIGVDIASESMITFHRFRTIEHMKRHHAIIYDSCPIGTVLHVAVRKGRDARDNSRVAVIARR
jgi:hypothetical protein